MKNLFLTLGFFTLSAMLVAQEAIEQKVLRQAQQMAKAFNENNLHEYVEYLTPSQYGNDNANKANYAKMWQKSKDQDTSQLRIIKIVELKSVNEEYQVILQHSYRQKIGLILGISEDKGNHWLFSPALTSDVSFSISLRYIPSLDSSFGPIIDPKFGKRIKYEVNESVADLDFIDIEGDSISLEKLPNKIIVLNFWSISCAPCIKEIPQLNELVRQMEGRNVIFIAPAFYSPKEYLKNFLSKHTFLYKVVNIEDPMDYDISAFPTHIIIDKARKVVYSHEGATQENLNAIRVMLEKMYGN